MIRVNLLPGGKKRAAKGGRSGRSLPSLKSLPLDRWVIAGGLVAVAALALIATRFQGIRAETADLEARTESEIADSIRFADLIVDLEALTARRDSVAARVDIIQQIDLDRYLWAHVLDEVARAVPDFTWLTSISENSTDPLVEFGIQGFAGSIPAVTVFMDNLEASPFLARVGLISTEMVSGQSGGGAVRNIFQFSLVATYEQPPLEFLETAPLFIGGAALPDNDDSSDGGQPPMEG